MLVTYKDHNSDGDLSVVNAARVSFAKEHDTFDTEKDKRLLNYLARHKHWSPFAHTYLKIHVKAPIFVARQLVKHQVGLVWNEVSRRYVDDDPEFFFPEDWRLKPSGSIKQGSEGVVEDEFDKWFIDGMVKEMTEDIVFLYKKLLNDHSIAPEQARMILPQNTYTEWYWTGNVMSFARVCQQRLDPHAQKETQEIAKQIADIATEKFPYSFPALLNTYGGE